MSVLSNQGLLIDYEYCTGCFACQIACAQEYGWEAGMSGIDVMEIVQDLPKGKAYLSFLPFPTELCSLCSRRTKKGKKPACVHHCMANVITHGRVEELAHRLADKPRMVLWSPK
ncbi:MAG: oxidoreductase [Desulfobacteraceae bacterium]|nr:MAG: oxidoreductase [Desulfobacteraceae bacterium]